MLELCFYFLFVVLEPEIICSAFLVIGVVLLQTDLTWRMSTKWQRGYGLRHRRWTGIGVTSDIYGMEFNTRKLVLPYVCKKLSCL